ncbi:MAG TPA: eL32 family ribosomal protein [Candidatus Nanoarchaeia archaeon]|nr:eL32 family ribosomal protein [Candidatus Nanoarchaeia archaeon]
MPNFIRRNWNRHSKLGKRRKKMRVWRRPTGRDNKMREKRKGYAPSVSIGYKKSDEIRSKIDGKTLILVNNFKDLEKVGKNLAVMGKIGMKKKVELLKRAKEMKLEFWNVNINKFLEVNKNEPFKRVPKP